MKIVVLKGSPHSHGSSNLLAEKFIQGAEENKHEILEFDVAHMNIQACIGCDFCMKHQKCIHQDENHLIKDALLSCDMVAFVTPMYYFDMSAQLKTCLDRFYGYNQELTDRHLKAVLIVSAMDEELECTKTLSAHYKALCSYLNFDNQGVLFGLGCGTIDMTKQSKYLLEAYELGKSLTKKEIFD